MMEGSSAVERFAVNEDVAGSSPAPSAIAPRYYWSTLLDDKDDGDLVIYGLKLPSFSFWMVPGTASEVA
jgi:hypothetical protein